MIILVVIQFISLSKGAFTLFDTNRDGMIDVWISNDSQTRLGEAVVEGNDGRKVTAPIKAYFPVSDTSILPSPPPLFTPLRNMAFSTLPRANNIHDQADFHVQIRVGFRNNNASTLYLFMAVKEEDDDYTAIQTVGSVPRISTGNYVEFDLTFSLQDLETFSNIDYENTRISTYSIYIFSNQNQLSPGDDLETANISMDEGLYFDLFFSENRPDEALYLERLTKGDERLWATFSRGQGIISNNLSRRMIVLRDIDCNNPSSEPSFQQSNHEILSYQDISLSGTLLIQQLENETPYCIRITMEDKFQFAAPLSNSLTETPEPIEALLDTQDCYLFSAGFKKDHYVIHTLRNFRDEYIHPFYWGQKLIDWYESTAPRHAQLIRNNFFLSFLIQTLGYLLFFLIKFHIFILFFPVMLFFIWMGRRFFLSTLKYP